MKCNFPPKPEPDPDPSIFDPLSPNFDPTYNITPPDLSSDITEEEQASLDALGAFADSLGISDSEVYEPEPYTDEQIEAYKEIVKKVPFSEEQQQMAGLLAVINNTHAYTMNLPDSYTPPELTGEFAKILETTISPGEGIAPPVFDRLSVEEIQEMHNQTVPFALPASEGELTAKEIVALPYDTETKINVITANNTKYSVIKHSVVNQIPQFNKRIPLSLREAINRSRVAEDAVIFLFNHLGLSLDTKITLSELLLKVALWEPNTPLDFSLFSLLSFNMPKGVQLKPAAVMNAVSGQEILYPILELY